MNTLCKIGIIRIVGHEKLCTSTGSMYAFKHGPKLAPATKMNEVIHQWGVVEIGLRHSKKSHHYNLYKLIKHILFCIDSSHLRCPQLPTVAALVISWCSITHNSAVDTVVTLHEQTA